MLKSTIGEYKEKLIKINNYNIIIQIFNSLRQERFRSISLSFFRREDGIVFVYDITSSYSFSNTKEWIIDLENYNTNI